jgi:hypothetical protein
MRTAPPREGHHPTKPWRRQGCDCHGDGDGSGGRRLLAMATRQAWQVTSTGSSCRGYGGGGGSGERGTAVGQRIECSNGAVRRI